MTTLQQVSGSVVTHAVVVASSGPPVAVAIRDKVLWQQQQEALVVEDVVLFLS